MTPLPPLDRFDRAILGVLAREGRLPVAALADRIGLSRTPTQARLKRLEAAGVIRGYAADIDPRATGRAQVCFVEVRLDDTREPALRAFAAAVRRLPEVESCHMIASGFDFLLKVRARDVDAYRRVLAEGISGLPHVASTSTRVVMETVLEGPPA